MGVTNKWIKDNDMRYLLIALQLFGWGAILGIAFYMDSSNESPSQGLFRVILFLANLMLLMWVYMINYFYFIPRFLFERKRWEFFASNALLIIFMVTITHSSLYHAIMEVFRPEYNHMRYGGGVKLYTIMREMVNYSLMVGLVTAVRLVQRLQERERELQKVEKARIEAELANLRSQINPHFLLNTLNNIYSLTAIDVDKAQNAIMELSRLLQYVLYDNHSDRVMLTNEVAFLENYIELMRLRLNRRIRLSIDFKIDPLSTTQIAPLVFISLIENAFKHGISADKESFVEIVFEDRVEQGEVYILIRNSNHATTESDKSGHGVGLEQVQSRHKLLNPRRRLRRVELDEVIYSSELRIKTT